MCSILLFIKCISYHDYMAQKGWQTVTLPTQLLELVDEVIENSKLGYTSKSEFIKEAVRERLLEIKKSNLTP